MLSWLNYSLFFFEIFPNLLQWRFFNEVSDFLPSTSAPSIIDLGKEDEEVTWSVVLMTRFEI